jgi:pimeloyl-ACP methyl ester carboxylesterase
MYHEAVKPSSC